MSFENISDQDLADLIGQMNYKLKADEAELERYKDEFKRRGIPSSWAASGSPRHPPARASASIPKR
jgi:hypothetical protein